MKSIFKTIGVVCAGLIGAILAMGSIVAEPLLRGVAKHCNNAADAIQKFDAELALKFKDGVTFGTATSSDVRRESNGYRQSSAIGTAEPNPAS